MSGVVVRPVRFTDDVPAMQRFLEAVGLRPRIASDNGVWVDMVAGGGMVALHSAASSDTGAVASETRLSFEADDIDVLAKELMAAGVDDVVVHDEAYGQVLTCRDPLGDPVVVRGRSHDLYGYRLVPGEPARAGIRVVPVRFTDPDGSVGPWLEALRLTPVDTHEFFRMFAAGGGHHGYVGLHRVYPEELPIVPGPAAVQLTFATTESLDDVAARLVEAGYSDVAVQRRDFGQLVTVTDPDGRECQVHELSDPDE